ncbi:hypothetical protein AXY17_RS16855 [Acinetobacter baumannii]|nr:hypothetical protein [Acinetobacter baumannii]
MNERIHILRQAIVVVTQARGAYSRQERQGQLRMNEYQEQHIQTFSQGREAAQHAMKKNRNLS